MKTTLTINTAVPADQVHGAVLYKNGVKYAELSKDEALKPWTDPAEAQVGDKYAVILAETPKKVLIDPNKPGSPYIDEHVHSLLSENFHVNPQAIVGAHKAYLTGTTA